jgi:CheY-like chemotaxis protein
VTALQLMRLRGQVRDREGSGQSGSQSSNQSSNKELAVIERQVRHLVRLVDDLLDVSRITRGKIALHRQPVEIADVVAKAVEMAGPLFEQHRHVLDIDVARAGLSVYADPDRLAQVVTNLLTNGAKYTPVGGKIGVSARAENRELVLRVIDNGVGIAPALLSQIFEPFVQGPRSIERSQGGLGIGLALVRSLVELHGGSVAAASSGADQGSEFVVRLPLLDAGATARVAAAEAAVPPSVERLRVLVVDDNRDAAELTAEVLRDTGYEVAVVFDPVAALAAARASQRSSDDGTQAVATRPADVAILDIGLPVMDGYELARQLRAIDGWASTRFIALTGYGQESDRARSDAAGFIGHLVKPVALDTLVRAIERCRTDGATPG